MAATTVSGRRSATPESTATLKQLGQQTAYTWNGKQDPVQEPRAQVDAKISVERHGKEDA